jgi:hypothetical protein
MRDLTLLVPEAGDRSPPYRLPEELHHLHPTNPPNKREGRESTSKRAGNGACSLIAQSHGQAELHIQTVIQRAEKPSRT